MLGGGDVRRLDVDAVEGADDAVVDAGHFCGGGGELVGCAGEGEGRAD